MTRIGNSMYQHKGYTIERIESEAYGKSYFFYDAQDRAMEIDPANTLDEAKWVIDNELNA